MNIAQRLRGAYIAFKLSSKPSLRSELEDDIDYTEREILRKKLLMLREKHDIACLTESRDLMLDELNQINDTGALMVVSMPEKL